MIITAVIYLFLYIMQGIVFPTNYAGNQLGIKSLSAVLNVLKTLFLSALPGYYAFVNDKYDYLFKVYNNGEINVENIRNMILWLFVLSFFYILYKILFREEQKGSAGLKKSIMMAVVAFIYCFLPALPNAVSVMYQENCSDTFFTSLPVSIFLYFAVMFLITLLLWGLLKKFNKKVFKIFLILIITFSASIIQINNYVFAEEQSRNFARIEEIEEFLQMEYVSILEGEKVTAPSLYETRNTLAIEAEHWTKYTAIYGKHIEILGNTDENTNWKLEMQDDNSFFLYDSEQKFLIAKDERAETFGVRNVDKELIIVQNAGCMYTEDNYYVYLLEEAE